MNTILVRSLVLTATLFAATHASAQATRTWVSGVGDDVNPCSRTAPCKTFAGAISKTATGGEINALDPAGYGTLTITKAITVDGAGTHASTLNSGGINGFVINAPGAVVTLRNLSINGAGTTMGLNGIRVLSVGELHIQNVVIGNVTAQGIDVQTTSGGHTNLFIDNVSIRNAGAGGIYIRPTSPQTVNASVNRVLMTGNGRGMRTEGGTIVTVRDSMASGNDANGFVALATDGRAVDLSLVNSTSANNIAAGIHVGAQGRIKMTGVTVTRNGQGMVAFDGGAIVSFGNNYVLDNNAFNGPASSTVPPL